MKLCKNKLHLYSKNARSCKECLKLWYINNADRHKMKAKEWRENNVEQRKNNQRKWYINNASHVISTVHEYQKSKKNNVIFKLNKLLRSRLNHAIKNNQKAGSAVSDLGCSINELKIHLECLFQPGMAWDNYGLKGWHIDHIKPLSSFDLSDSEQFKEACHYTNLQPLWAKDNLRKSDKYVNN